MCGIAGFVSKKKKPFDYSGFCTLGIANDVRGGDSCGIFIDGLNQYGTGKEKLFSSFFLYNKSLRSVKTASVAFVHCRKASVGAINEKTAQPVVIKGKNGKASFVLMHNGTIHNYEELAKKYIPNVDIRGMTDSQVMARIFYNTGYGVLNEYNGAAVFAIVDYRNGGPRVLFWKGASKKTSASKEQEEERPLYYCYDNEQIIFSSIYVHLVALRKHSTTRMFPENILCEYKNNRLYIVAKYDRKDMTQNKQFVSTYYGVNYNNRCYNGYYESNSWNKNNNVNNQTTVKQSSYHYLGRIDYFIGNHLYKIDSTLAHGMKRCTNYGTLLPDDTDEENCLTLWFFHGRMLYDHKCYKFLEMMKRKAYLPDDEFDDAFRNIIGFLSVQQIFMSTDNKFMIATSPSTCRLFSGFVYPPITSSVTNIQLGVRLSSSFNGYDNYKRVFDDMPSFNFSSIKKQSLKILDELTI